MERPMYRTIKFPAKHSRQLRVVRRERRERRDENWEGNERRRTEGAVDSNSQQAMIRPGKFFFYANEKERKL